MNRPVASGQGQRIGASAVGHLLCRSTRRGLLNNQSMPSGKPRGGSYWKNENRRWEADMFRESVLPMELPAVEFEVEVSSNGTTSSFSYTKWYYKHRFLHLPLPHRIGSW